MENHYNAYHYNADHAANLIAEKQMDFRAGPMDDLENITALLDQLATTIQAMLIHLSTLYRLMAEKDGWITTTQEVRLPRGTEQEKES